MPIISGGQSGSASGAGTEIGYDQITALVSVVSTTESSGTTIISAAAHTFDGQPVMATFFAPYCLTDNVAGHQLVICLFEAATEIGRIGNLITPAALAVGASITGQLRFTPTSGSHTYTVTAFMTAGTGTVGADTAGTGKNVAAFLRFTKV